MKANKKANLKRYTYFGFDGTSQPRYSIEIKVINYEERYIKMNRGMTVNAAMDKLCIPLIGISNWREYQIKDKERQRINDLFQWNKEHIIFEESYNKWIESRENK